MERTRESNKWREMGRGKTMTLAGHTMATGAANSCCAHNKLFIITTYCFLIMNPLVPAHKTTITIPQKQLHNRWLLWLLSTNSILYLCNTWMCLLLLLTL